MYSLTVAYILWLFSGFGALGFHRFYLGKFPSGLLWMFTGGLFGIGGIFDFFTMPAQVRAANLHRALLDSLWRRGGNQGFRNIVDGEVNAVREQKTVEQTILKIAKENKGIISASELAMEASIPIEEAKKVLDALVSKGIAELRVRKSGSLVYTIPDIMDKDEPLENL
ncbi:MAG: NINE protein [Spirochaetes bacterium]|nr:NINE protein [Spirochaetota bacterium]